MKRKWYFIAPAGLLAICLFIGIGGEVVRLLWNWIMPELFGLHEITFWQAIGVLALSRILFGTWGRNRSGGSKMWRRKDPLTREEYEQRRQKMRERFGCGPAPQSE
jgi:hypothetical protein